MSKSKTIKRRKANLQGKVEAAANGRLKSCPYPGVKRLMCEFNAGSLILKGRVTTFFEKQLAQEAVGHLDGVQQLVNGVEVA